MSEYFLLQIPYNSAFTTVECEFSRDTPKNNGLISIYGKSIRVAKQQLLNLLHSSGLTVQIDQCIHYFTHRRQHKNFYTLT